MERLFPKLWLWVVFVLVLKQEVNGCLEKERLGLMELKAFFNSSSNVEDHLPSWVDESKADCCSWELVKCNQTTSHVTDLLLEGVAGFRAQVWLLNFSLFRPFESLARLDLSGNNFGGWVEMEGLCGMKNLQELDLSQNSMSGHFPECLGNLTNLRVLDLSSNNLNGNIPSFITEVKSLEYLSLYDNNYDGSFSFGSLANHSKLEVFLLSSSTSNLHVETEIPSWFPTFQLKVLQLRNCNLNSQKDGITPNFLLHQHDLRVIDLSHNKLAGNFPSWLLMNNTKLETLYLMNNSFTGTLQLPSFRHGLLDLQVSNNKIEGQFPANIGEIFSNIFYVNLSRNSLEGILPSSMAEMHVLRTLDLSYNNFSGELTTQLFNCTSLMLLRLSHNSFQGPILPRFVNLTGLQWLYLNDNSFSGELEDGIFNKSQFYTLDISNNKISGRIPRWIGSFKGLWVLLMAKNLFEGDIPDELCNISNLNYLDISENNLSGTLPSCFSNLSDLQFLYLQKNSFRDYIPHVLSELSRLLSLDLRDNKFLGNIPYWINKLSQLRVLLLGGNELNGTIPIQLCELEHVKIMDLSHNWLTGAIPSCFKKISFLMKEHGIAEGSTAVQYSSYDTIHYYYVTAYFVYELIETWYEPGNTFHNFYKSSLGLNWLVGDHYKISYEQVEVEFRTKSNYLSYKGYNLELMTGLDLSSNKLSGSIPPQIGGLREIFALNLSHNQLSGFIPESFSNLAKIESLDLSYNKLSGGIPPKMSELYSLAIFNVSYNNFSGRTPITGQFANFDEDNYRGNSGLCGPTLKRSCTSTISPTPPPASHEGAGIHTLIDMVSFYWSFVGSYVTVVLGLATILWVNPHWCRAWFHVVDLCIYYCFPWFFRNGFY